jgi:hypothetical protein
VRGEPAGSGGSAGGGEGRGGGREGNRQVGPGQPSVVVLLNFSRC